MHHLLTCLLLCATLVAQDPAAPAPTAVRLTYELPVDALQRATTGKADIDIEEVLTLNLEVMTQRLDGLATVRRKDASRVEVDVPSASEAKLQRVRRLAERPGTLSMRIVAAAEDDAGRQQDDTLAAERHRPQLWLADGNLQRVLEDPHNLAAYRSGDRARIVWVAHRIHRDAKRWSFSYAQMPIAGDAVLPLYDGQQWNNGDVPAGQLAADDACLLELMALDLSRGGFSNEHLDTRKVYDTKRFTGRSAVYYELLPDHAKRYGDWSERNVNRMCAIVVDGEALIARSSAAAL